MVRPWLGAGLIGGLACAAPAAAWAQSPSAQPSIMQEETQPAAPAAKPAKPPARRARPQQPQQPTSQLQPDLDAADQLAPSQMQQPMPSAVPLPGKPAKRAPRTAAEHVPAPVPGARSIACSGAFGKDSSHLKLAIAFDSRNITFTEVDGGSVGKVQASVIYPNDPKRRLEVWWHNPASRSDTYLVVIGGQSGWMAPKGVRLGLPLSALEKLNKKPFKLKGLAVSDWDGGALGTLPGGCKIGVTLTADTSAPEEARKAVAESKDFASADESLRAAKPKVSEIIIGY